MPRHLRYRNCTNIYLLYYQQVYVHSFWIPISRHPQLTSSSLLSATSYFRQLPSPPTLNSLIHNDFNTILLPSLIFFISLLYTPLITHLLQTSLSNILNPPLPTSLSLSFNFIIHLFSVYFLTMSHLYSLLPAFSL